MKRMEIGSEFWSGCSEEADPIKGVSQGMSITLPSDFCIVNTLCGRTALELIVEELCDAGKRSAYMPSYCCHTMIEPFVNHGIKVEFYDVLVSEKGFDRHFRENHECDIIFLLDYFGFIDSQTKEIADNQRKLGKTVICDCTHSLYSAIDISPYDYLFGSYRKWANINCGFVASRSSTILRQTEKLQQSLNSDEYITSRTNLFDLKAHYMSGGIDNKDSFLPLIGSAEDALERDYHYKAPDDKSIEVLSKIDIQKLKDARRRNAEYLIDGIKSLNDDRIRLIHDECSESEVPLFVPVYVQPNLRDSLRKELISKDIYCPVHWPLSDLHTISSAAKELYRRELSLVCDQRYSLEDMGRIMNEIALFINNWK